MTKGETTEGTIIKGIGGFYYVRTKEEVLECKAKGIFKKRGIIPCVGDRAKVQIGVNQENIISEIMERKNIFVRPPISNVDGLVIVMAAKEPAISFLTLDKFLVMAEKNHIEPIICINKIDIEAAEEKVLEVEKIYGNIYKTIRASAKQEQGITDLRKGLPEGNVAFAGPSGVGKSSLLNRLLETSNIETGDVSSKNKRGKHTTRHVEIFELSSKTRVFDTPGFTSLQVVGVDKKQLDQMFPEIDALRDQCKYQNCKHLNEPKCAVKQNVENNKIAKSRYDSYKWIFKQLEEEND